MAWGYSDGLHRLATAKNRKITSCENVLLNQIFSSGQENV